MKLLFPLVASLMLQYQVKSEFVVVKRCIMGFGKCKDSCFADEIEIQNCKSKKCCIGPKVTELIKSYLRHEIPHIPDKDIVEMLRSEKNSREETRRKHTLAALSEIQDASPLLGINSEVVPKASPVKLVTSRTGRRGLGGTVSTKRHMKPIRGSASVAPQPRPGPP
ncbi:beta-defensin 129 [Phodopus roborovskii]|uniref:Beta-defensin n=1 Tax=Phodopus roborovskii TaxID=109678 RepID=A0AAU9YRC1_PHORO|nr:beta-defensin 129 [Phodopus roborovskii]CAH6777094.1 Defb23 [Phodopus roborovskii]